MTTNKQKFLKLHSLPKETSLSIEDISELSGIPEDALQEVYNRGIGAYRGNLGSVRLTKDFSKNPNTKKYPAAARLSKEQWAAARVYAFVSKTKKVYYGADNDIRVAYGLE
jgi:hypothetical protein